MQRFQLLCAVAVPVLASSLLASPASFAQTAVSPPAGAAASATAAQDDWGNEIVVTANRRAEPVQDVPIAVTAVNAKLLDDAGVRDIRGLEQLAPSLQTTTGQSSATATSLSIRGVGTAGDNPGFEPAVGVFIDGVFRARAGIAIAELPEVERIEVLRGPQGTLFGRNTSAGALSIFTARPQFDLGGYVEGQYGNFGAYEVKGALTGPVADTLALRVDGGYRKRDGYIRDVNSDRAFNDIDRWYVRGQALYDTSAFSFRLIGDYYKTDEQCCGVVSGTRGPTAGAIQAIATAQGRTGIYSGPPSDRKMAATPGRDYGEAVRDWGVSGEINADIGTMKLTSISAYRNWQVLRNQDIDYSGIDRAYREGYRSSLRDITQELRLQGQLFAGKLDFLVGGFYLNEQLKLRDTVRLGADANRYVDTLLGGALAAPPSAGGVGRQAQFYGSFNVPTFTQLVTALRGGAALPSGTVPLFGQLLHAQNAALQTAAPPGSALFNYLNTPLAGNQPGQGNNNDDFTVDTNAFALFTHNIVNLTDKLSLTMGLRYNYERKELAATVNSNPAACGFFLGNDPSAIAYRNAIRTASPALFQNLFLLSCNPAISSEFNGSYAHRRTESRLTGTAKLAYKFTPDILGYGSYDRGFKSGGYNLDQASFNTTVLGGDGAQATDLEFGAETVDSYELGLKTSLTRQFSFNAALFYQKFRGLQSLIFAGNSFVVQNVPKSTAKGIELESVIQPIRELTFRLGYTLLDASYDRSNDFSGTPLQNQNGRQFLNQPRNVVTVAATWTPPLTDKLNALFHVDMRYNSDVSIARDGTGATTVGNDGYPLLNGKVGVQTDDRRISAEFFVENITNQYYNISGFAIPEQTGTYGVYPAMPRFYGVRGRFGF
jgi:outer membrane receptor protein involved in Fe transport